MADSAIAVGGGGGRGGSGFALGPVQNQFATAAARNTYATANADWLAEYNGDRSLWIQVGADIQRRNAAGNAWEAVTAILSGTAATNAAIDARIAPYGRATPSGMIANAQIPAGIMRDDEFTAAAVRGLLGLTAAEVTGLLVGQPISGNVLTFTQNDGSSASITVNTGSGGGSADGVVASGAFSADNTELILTLDTGDMVTINVPAALRAAGGLTETAGDARYAQLTGAEFTGAVEVDSPSGGPLTVQGGNAGNSTIMKIFTPDSGSQKAFGAGREGEFDWVQFAGEIVAGKPGFALGPGTARDTNLYRDAADVLKTDDAFVAEGTVSGAAPTADEHLVNLAYFNANSGGGGTPVDHTRYGSLGADATFVAGDFTGGSGFNSDTNTLAVPAFATDQFLAFAIRDDIADPTDIREEGSAFNSLSLFTKQAAQIAISTDMYNVWISNAALLSNNSAQNWVIS